MLRSTIAHWHFESGKKEELKGETLLRTNTTNLLMFLMINLKVIYVYIDVYIYIYIIYTRYKYRCKNILSLVIFAA
jgi:hypothetical protein